MPSAVAMAPKLTKNQMRRAKKKEQKKSQVGAVDELFLKV
jgi:splicing factor 3B subunit 2